MNAAEKMQHECKVVHDLVVGLDWRLMVEPSGYLRKIEGWAHPDSTSAIHLQRSEEMLRKLADEVAAKRRKIVGNDREAA